MSSPRGLPRDRRMRHDPHFVEELISDRHGSFGRLIDIDRLEANPHQPRKHFGDLSDLVESIREKGVLVPILVRKRNDRFQIIAGERRYQASKLAGLTQVPCVEIDVDNRGSLEISLIENIQRRDLSAFEEAAAIQKLCDQFGYTHEQVSKKLGKSRISVTEILSLNRMPEEIQDLCRQADISSRSTLLEIVRQKTKEEMHELVARIASQQLKREEVRDIKRESGSRRPSRNRNFVYRYSEPEKKYSVQIRFPRSEVDRAELIDALRGLLERLLTEESSEDSARSTVRTPSTRRRATTGDSPN